MTRLETPGGYVLPPGSPPGELPFLVGIQANESGFDYFRDQGSAGGSIGTYGGGAEEGFGAYQFTGDINDPSSDVAQAAAAGWAPEAQDRIASDMATGYYHEFLPLAVANNVNPWEYVAEAWYGPGTVPQEPIAANSVEDVQNVLNAEAGHAALPEAWVYGPGYKGLTSAQVAAELGGKPVSVPGGAPVASSSGSASSSTGSSSSGTTATLTGLNWNPFDFFGVGSVASSAVSDLEQGALKIGLYVVGAVAGAAFIILGVRDLGGRQDAGGGGKLEQAASLAPLVAAA